MSRLARLFDRFRPARAGRPPENAEARWAIVGLGNPDERYRRSRHNAGFMVIDSLARQSNAALSKRRVKGATARALLDGQPVLLVQPLTYYNLSGECVSALRGYFKIPVERLVVVHDELDLEPGRIQVRRGGGDAGNRGIRSIIDALGSPDFIRVRIGIGHPLGGEDEKDYLLRAMSSDELAEFAAVIERAAGAVRAVVTQDLTRAMNAFNQWPLRGAER